MKPESWELAKRAFHAALDAPTESRPAVIIDLCTNDDAARAEAERMLAHADAPSQADTPATPPDDAVGPRRIGRFEIQECIGTGASGRVYRAHDALTSRTVAIKVLKLTIESERTRRRIEYEGEILSKFDHPGIARVYEVGTTPTEFGTLPFVAMELVEGEPIDTYAETHQLDDRARIGLVVRVCDAVAYAHHRGIIHRDLKPANIIIDNSGRPRLLDFGIARNMTDDRDIDSLATRTGDVLGTPGYMSPEQAGGSADTADTRADVYSLGVILYELLTRQRLFDVHDMSLLAALECIGHADPPLLGTSHPHLRGAIEAIIAKALDRNPRRRYDTAALFATDLRRHLQGLEVSADPVSMTYHLRRAVRRHRGVLTVAGSLVAALSLALGVLSYSYAANNAKYREMESVLLVLSSPEPAQARGHFDSLVDLLPLSGFDDRGSWIAFDAIAFHLLNRCEDPEYAAIAYRHALDAKRREAGEWSQQVIRSVQVYTEALSMSGGAGVAFDLATRELDRWGFQAGSPIPDADVPQSQRLLRLAMTRAEAEARIGRPDAATDYLQLVLAAQQTLLVLADGGRHTDITDSEEMLAWIDANRARFLANPEQ